MKNKPHGSTGNQNAVSDNPKTSVLTIRCTPEDKSKWAATAGDKSLAAAAWATKILNAASKN